MTNATHPPHPDIDPVQVLTGVFWRRDGIFYYKSDSGPPIEEFRSNYASIATLIKGSKNPVVWLAQDSAGMSNADVRTMIRLLPANATSLALVGGQPIPRHILRLYMAVKDADVPTAIFEQEEEALGWSRRFLPASTD